MNNESFERFISNLLGEKITNFKIFYLAFTHPSFDFKNNYEKLELLGDAVLNLAITHILFNKFPDKDEGYITQERISYVNGRVISKISILLGFDGWIRLGKGEKKDAGNRKDSILANVFEAFIGALYLEKGIDFVIDWILKHFMIFDSVRDAFKDYKSILQEYLQEKKLKLPEYEIESEEGQSHNKTFYVKLTLFDNMVFIGVGKTKKSAEQDAAKKALELLGKSGLPYNEQ
jgi:ribonuclease III